MLDNDKKQLIVNKINERIKGLTCPMCKTNQFSLAEGYFLNPIQVDLSSISIGGPSIPTVAIICNNCGFVSQHALGVLGLLPKEQDIKADEPNK